MPDWLIDIAGPDYAAGVLWTVAALVLLVAGGIGLHSTYQSALVVVGLAAMASGLRTPCPRTEPATAPLPVAVAAIPATR